MSTAGLVRQRLDRKGGHRLIVVLAEMTRDEAQINLGHVEFGVAREE